MDSLGAFMKVPEMAEVRFSVYDDRYKKCVDQFYWEHFTTLGNRSLDGQQLDYTLKVDDYEYVLNFSSEEDSFVIKIVPETPNTRYKLLVCGMMRWNREASISFHDKKINIQTQGKQFDIEALADCENSAKINTNHSGFIIPLNQTIYIRCNNTMTISEMEKFIEKRRKDYSHEGAVSFGAADETASAILKAMTWNTVYEPNRDRYVTPVTRRWCNMRVMTHFGNYVLFEWDTFFGSLLCGLHDKEFAYRQVESILEEFEKGVVPGSGSQVRIRSERSQPPVGSYCILKLYRQFGEVSFLQDVFDKLVAWNAWWFQNRDGNHNGLLEWGCNENEEWPLPEKWLHHDAMYESGMDNSPSHDGVGYNMETNTLEQDYIELNSLYALDCLCLSTICEILDKKDLSVFYKNEHSRISTLINEKMWNEELGIYCDLKWDNTFSNAITPGSFYTMIAGVATKDRAERMMLGWFLNENKFFGEFMLPSIAKDHPAFHDNDYWRGRIWAPMNFLVGEGLKRHGYYDLAYMLANKSNALFRRGWKNDKHIYENYNSANGSGGDVENSDTFYTWGGLLPYMYLSELFESQAFGGLRFGNLSNDYAELNNVKINNDTYDIKKSKELTVFKNNKNYISSTTPILITDWIAEKGTLRFKLKATGEGILKIALNEETTEVDVRSDNKIQKHIENGICTIHYFTHDFQNGN